MVAKDLVDIEEYARLHPEAYKVKVFLWAALGYGYIFALIALTVSSAIGTIWLFIYARTGGVVLGKILIVLLPFLYLLLRSLFVSIPPVEGMEITEEHAPELFALVRKVTRKLGAPFPDHILLDTELNAAAVQRPRLGIFGWHQNTLLLGLPLLQLLDLDEFTSVIAHEFGHFSAQDGRFGNWIYRLRTTWWHLLSSVDRNSSKDIFFRPFFHWYYPKFSTYSFALRRQCEYAADSRAAEVAGTEAAVRALVRIEIICRGPMPRFWKQTGERAVNHPEAPSQLLFGYISALRSDITQADAEDVLRKALREEPSRDDSHPTLIQRVGEMAGIGGPELECHLRKVTDSILAGSFSPAADKLLASTSKSVQEHLNQDFTALVGAQWQESFQVAEEQRARLHQLRSRQTDHGPLSREEQCEEAGLVRALEGSKTALPLYEALYAADQEDYTNAALYADVLLENDDKKGADIVDRIISSEVDPQLVLIACQSALDYGSRNDDTDIKSKYEPNYVKAYESLILAQAELEQLNSHNEFKPAIIDGKLRSDLALALSGLKKVREAYLVAKILKHFPKHDQYVLFIVPHYPFFCLDKTKFHNVLMKMITELPEVPKDTFILIGRGGYREIASRICAVTGAKLPLDRTLSDT